MKIDHRRHRLTMAAAALLAILAAPRAAAAPDDALAKTLERQLVGHFDALNEEKIEEAMKLVHRSSPTFAATRDALLKLYQAGLIDEETALEQSPNSEQLQMNMRGIFLGEDRGMVG